jgi:hypothetical protein
MPYDDNGVPSCCTPPPPCNDPCGLWVDGIPPDTSISFLVTGIPTRIIWDFGDDPPTTIVYADIDPTAVMVYDPSSNAWAVNVMGSVEGTGEVVLIGTYGLTCFHPEVPGPDSVVFAFSNSPPDRDWVFGQMEVFDFMVLFCDSSTFQLEFNGGTGFVNRI